VTEAILAARARLEAAAAKNVCSAFAATVGRIGPAVALRGRETGGQWSEMSWDAYAHGACRVASALDALGLRRGERVALMMRSRPEFHLVDMGTMLAGGTPLSIYNSSPPVRVSALLGHSQAVIAVVEDRFLERLEAVRDQLPALRHVVVVGDTADPAGKVVPWSTLLDASPVDLQAAADAVSPEDEATVIYTSGTTGAPKGVLHTHRATAINMAMFSELWGSLQGLQSISYLPMAHISERNVTHYVHVTMGTVVSCCPDLVELPAVMAEVHPHWWFCAPRMWEKLKAGIEALMARDPARAEAFQSARALGAEVRALRAAGRPVHDTLAAQWDRARREVIQPVLAPLGLDRVRIATTGAAPTPRETHEFFLDCGMPLSEAYGLSECPGITCDPVDVVPGTAGKPFPGVEVRLADDGEILARGPTLFAGYLDEPDSTAEAIDADGWLHTGDLGVFDEAGNLSVIDRKKEIIVCSSGHNVSPVQVEAALKESVLVGQACVVGHGRPHVVALLVLDPEGAGTFARREGLDGLTLADLARHPVVLAAVEHDVAIANERFPRAEQVRAFHLLGEEWLPDSDLLTPTAKLKRREVVARYQTEIDKLYAD
jgi:long-chain acyl-CoA synthetase